MSSPLSLREAWTGVAFYIASALRVPQGGQQQYFLPRLCFEMATAEAPVPRNTNYATGWRARMETVRNWPSFGNREAPSLEEWLFWARGFWKSPIALSEPWITFRAIRALESLVKPGMRIFEFGCGGSTLFFARRGAHVTSVEHDPGWAALVRDASRGLTDPPVIHEKPPCIRGDVPKVGSTRHIDPHADFSAYVEAIATVPDETLDLVCVDGRARVACALAARRKVRRGGWLLLDNSEREDYRDACMAFADWPVERFFGLGRKNLGPWETSFWKRP